MSAIMLAVSAARFKSDEYIAANLGSLDSRPATLHINRDSRIRSTRRKILYGDNDCSLQQLPASFQFH